MNLHLVANGTISAVNRWIPVTLQVNTGYTTAADGSRSPTYIHKQKVSAQIQALSYDELRLVDALNIQGTKRAIYLSGQLLGVNRERNRGGDLIVFPKGWTWPYGTIWLTVFVVEQWHEWVKVAVVQQVDNLTTAMMSPIPTPVVQNVVQPPPQPSGPTGTFIVGESDVGGPDVLGP